MDILLFLVVIVQLLAFLWEEHKNRQEREKLEMMIKSKDVVEFKEAVEPPPEPEEIPEPTHVPLDDVPLEDLMKAKDYI